MGRKPTLILEDVKALVAEGFPPVRIAEAYGTSRAAVSKFLKAHGIHTREQSKDFPYVVPVPMQGNQYKRLHDLASYNGGRVLSADNRQRLRAWVEKLRSEKLVVEFNPNFPPEFGVSGSEGGWAFQPRTDADGNLAFRVNAFSNVTDRARKLYALPEDEIPS